MAFREGYQSFQMRPPFEDVACGEKMAPCLHGAHDATGDSREAPGDRRAEGCWSQRNGALQKPTGPGVPFIWEREAGDPRHCSKRLWPCWVSLRRQLLKSCWGFFLPLVLLLINCNFTLRKKKKRATETLGIFNQIMMEKCC